MVRNCLLCWLLGYVFGTLLGRLSDAFVQFFDPIAVFLLLALLVFVLGKKHKQVLIFLCAWVWGLNHSAPLPDQALENVRVVRKNLIPLGVGMLVRTSSAKAYFYVTASGPTGQTGDVVYSSQPTLFFASSGIFQPHFTRESQASVLKKIRVALDRRIRQLPLALRGFSDSILLGDRHSLDTELSGAFKKLGIFHLLVVSGLHVSFLSTLLLWLVFIPFQGAYAACFLGPRAWFVLKSLLLGLSIFFVTSYAWLIGIESQEGSKECPFDSSFLAKANRDGSCSANGALPSRLAKFKCRTKLDQLFNCYSLYLTKGTGLAGDLSRSAYFMSVYSQSDWASEPGGIFVEYYRCAIVSLCGVYQCSSALSGTSFEATQRFVFLSQRSFLENNGKVRRVGRFIGRTVF